MYTPGPWKISKNGKDGNTFTIWRNDPKQPDESRNEGYALISKHIHGEANAKLIASAPDLLEACKKAKKLLEPELKEPARTIFWKLVEAIKRAEG